MGNCSCVTLEPRVVRPSSAAYDDATGDLVWNFRGGHAAPTGDYVWSTCNPIARVDEDGHSATTADLVGGSATSGSGGNPPATRLMQGIDGTTIAKMGAYTGLVTWSLGGTARLARFDDTGLVDEFSATTSQPLRVRFSSSEAFLGDATHTYRLIAGDSNTAGFEDVHQTSDLIATTGAIGMGVGLIVRNWAGTSTFTNASHLPTFAAWSAGTVLYTVADISRVVVSRLDTPYSSVSHTRTLTGAQSTIYSIGVLSTGNVVVVSGVSLLSRRGGRISVLSGSDLSLLWSTTIGTAGTGPTNSHWVNSICEVGSGNVFAFLGGRGIDGKIVLLDASTGSATWSRDLHGEGPVNNQSATGTELVSIHNATTGQVIVSSTCAEIPHWRPV